MDLKTTLEEIKQFCDNRKSECIGCEFIKYCINMTERVPADWVDKSNAEGY